MQEDIMKGLPSPRPGGSKHLYSMGRESISTLLFSQPAKISSTGEQCRRGNGMCFVQTAVASVQGQTAHHR